MDKCIFDESNGLWYELHGVIIFLALLLPTEKEHKPFGLWRQWYKRYLQEHKKAFYASLLTSGKLNSYLADIDNQRTEMMFRLIEKMANNKGVIEHLKATNQMAWVGAMNNIRNIATEIENTELIYT